MPNILTTAFYLEKLKDILPEWDIMITPDDLLENSQKYDKVKIKLVNTTNKINKEIEIPLYPTTSTSEYDRPSWYRSGIITTNIASVIYKNSKKPDSLLLHILYNYINRFCE